MTLVVVLVVVGLLLCGGLVVAGILGVRAVLNATSGPRDAATEFLNELVDGDPADAHALLCRSAQQRTSVAELAEVAEELDGFRITGVSVERDETGSNAAVTTRLRLSDGSRVTEVLTLVREGGEWRVCGDPF